MKRTIIGSLSILFIQVITVSSLQASTIRSNSGRSNHYSSQTRDTKNVTPYDLAFLAYRGAFIKQGIPSYTALLSAHKSGKISARNLVQIAINQKKLSAQFLNDRAYLNAVESALHLLAPH